MLAIVTSLRARALAQNWDHHVRLLESALKSMLANGGDIKIVVVCHDIPETNYSRHPAVRFMNITAPIPTRNNDDMCVDKAIKLSAGAECAIRQGCSYIMFTDADDLVSNRISKLVSISGGKSKGWYSDIEYHFVPGDFFVRSHRMPTNQSGSCIIIRSDLMTFSEPPFEGSPWLSMIAKDKDYCAWLVNRGHKVNGLAAVGHTDYLKLLAIEGHVLSPLPFAANFKIRHHDSTSQVPGGIGSAVGTGGRQSQWRRIASGAKHRCRELPSLRLVTPGIRREYSLASQKDS